MHCFSFAMSTSTKAPKLVMLTTVPSSMFPDFKVILKNSSLKFNYILKFNLINYFLLSTTVFSPGFN